MPQDPGGLLDVDVEAPLADPAVWSWVYRTSRPAKAAALAERIPRHRLGEVAARLDGSGRRGPTA